VRDVGDELLAHFFHFVELRGHVVHGLDQLTDQPVPRLPLIEAGAEVALGDALQCVDDGRERACPARPPYHLADHHRQGHQAEGEHRVDELDHQGGRM
jgi:hypothetical protein